MKTRLFSSIMVILLLSVMGVFAASSLDVSNPNNPSVNPGAQTTVTFDVEYNGGDPAVSVAFTSTSLVSGSNSITAPSITNLAVDNGTPASHSFAVAISSGTVAGTYSGTLSASATDSSIPITLSDVQAYTVTVNPVGAFSLSSTSMSLSTQDDVSVEQTFTVTNTGSVDLAMSFAHPVMEDNDQDQISVTFKDGSTVLAAPLNLTPGQQKTITAVFAVENKMDIDTYSGTLTVSATPASGPLVASQTIATSVEVIPEVCKDGVIGDLDLSVDNPDENDKFNPGETMNVKANVENNGDDSMRVVVEALLYNMDTGRLLASSESDAKKINDDSDEDFTVELRVPTTDFDASDSYRLFVKASEDGNEEDHCNYETVDVDLDRESDAVVVDSFAAQPESVECGSTVLLTAEVKNVGEDDQDGVYVKMMKGDLGLDWQSDSFNLDSYDDDNSDKTVTFLLKVPKDAKASSYLLSAMVYYNDGDDSDEETLPLTVTCGSGMGSVTGGATSGSLDLNLAQESMTLTGKKFSLNFALVNKGSDVASGFTVDVTELGSWARLTGLEVPTMLNPGESYNGYAYFEVAEGAEAGAHNFRLNVRSNAGLMASKLVTATVGEAAPEPVVQEAPKGLLGDKSKLFWIIGDIVLVVLAVLFLRLLFKK